MAENCAQTAVAHLAAIFAGAAAVPVNWQLRPAEAAHILRDSGARLVLASARTADAARQAAPGALVVESLTELPASAARSSEPPADMALLVSSVGRRTHSCEEVEHALGKQGRGCLVVGRQAAVGEQVPIPWVDEQLRIFRRRDEFPRSV